MKINNWVLKAGVPLGCFHLRFITADTEVQESEECEGEKNVKFPFIARSFISRFAAASNHCRTPTMPRYAILCHAIACHVMS